MSEAICPAHPDDCRAVGGGHACCLHPGHPGAHMCLCFHRWTGEGVAA